MFFGHLPTERITYEESKKKFELTVDAVWDIECANWDEFLCGALWTRKEGTRVTRDPSQLARWIMELPTDAQTWAHSGGKYDVLWWIEQQMRDHGRLPDASVYLSGGSASGVRVQHGPWLRDSARLIPMSLAKASTWINNAKTTLSLPCFCDEQCGGYCSLASDMPESYWTQTIDYLIRDVQALRDLLFALFEFGEQNQIEIRGTIGGSAWATAQAWCGVPDASLPWDTYSATRQGYYGGRVEVARTTAPNIYRYDRRGAYLASLLEPLPTGKYRSIDKPKPAMIAFRRDNPGVYHCHVFVPESMAPPLPVRTGDRLAYPWGILTGQWTSVELQHAIDCGAKIIKMESAVVWQTQKPVLARYAKRIGELRDIADSAHGAGKAASTWLKFLGNSLTGKLGQDPDWPTIKLGDYADDPRYECVGASPWVWSRTVLKMADCAYPQWAAFLTARARVDLHMQIMHAGDAWCYSDTDSVICTSPLARNIGDGLGQWQFEGVGTDWRALAPKVYAYDTAGAQVRHAKGVPGAEKDAVWQRYADGKTVTNERGVLPLMTAARGNKFFARRKTTRTMRPRATWIGARIRVGESDTRSPNVKELDALKSRD